MKITVETRRSSLQSYLPGEFISNGHYKSQIETTYKGDKLVQRLIDNSNLTTPSTAHFDGATIYVEPAFIPHPIASSVLAYDPEESSLRVNLKLTANASPILNSRYFFEGLPQFLDIPGEFAFNDEKPDITRLYLRLQDDEIRTIFQ